MQIASLFASLGFKVDTKGLDAFQSKLREVRGDTALFARNARALAANLRSMSSGLDGVTNRLDKLSLKRANANISESYTEVAKSVARVHNALNGISNNQKRITLSLGKIHSSVKAGQPIWERYKQSVLETQVALVQINAQLRQIRSNSPIRINNNSSGSGRPSPRGSQRQNGLNLGGSEGILAGGGFFRSMLPAVATAGGLPTLGYTVSKIVEQGREVQKMDIVLKMASSSAEEFGRNLEFVRKTAQEVSVDVTEFGQAYAKMLQATKGVKGLGLEDKEKMFKDLSIYMRTIGSSADDQKGIFRALTQMFTKGKVQAEELLQMAERGVPAAIEIKKAAIEGLKMTEKQFELAQKKGELDPAKLLPIMSANLAKLAQDSGAYEKALQTSATAQQRFKNELKLLSDELLQGGLDQGLKNLFESLTDLIKVTKEGIQWLKGFKKGLDEVSGGNSGLILSLAALSLVIFRFRKPIMILWQSFKLVRALGGGLSTFFSGTFVKSILRLGGKLFWLVTAFEAVIAIGNALNKEAEGTPTWISWWILNLETLYVNVVYYIAKMRYEWAKFTNDMSNNAKLSFFGGELESDRILNKAYNKGNKQTPSGSPDTSDKVKGGAYALLESLKYLRNEVTSGRLGRISYEPSQMSNQGRLGYIEIMQDGKSVGRLDLDSAGNNHAKITSGTYF
ncbi:tape measure protein [Acinetobacter phage TaPaz]|nr:tape measure protein [Acinetobacter phage TaPaz]